MGENPVRRSLCGGADITPRTQITVYGNSQASITFLIKGGSAVSGRAIGANVGSASVCLDCGHLLWACDDKESEKLRARRGDLASVWAGQEAGTHGGNGWVDWDLYAGQGRHWPAPGPPAESGVWQTPEGRSPSTPAGLSRSPPQGEPPAGSWRRSRLRLRSGPLERDRDAAQGGGAPIGSATGPRRSGLAFAEYRGSVKP